MDLCPLCERHTFPEIRIDDLSLIGQDLRYGSWAVRISPRESRFLSVLLRFWPHYVPLERCLFATWPDEEPGNPENTLRSYAHSLRHKLAPSGLAVWGKPFNGYKFFLPDEFERDTATAA